MKKFLLYRINRRAAGLVALLPLLAAGGCTAGKSDLASGGSDRTVKEQLPDGVREGARILNAFQKRDYGVFCNAVPEEIASSVSQKDFTRSVAEINRQFGELQEFSFLTSLVTPGFSNLLWKTVFVRDSADGRRKIKQELLFRVIAGNNEKGTQIISFGFL